MVLRARHVENCPHGSGSHGSSGVVVIVVVATVVVVVVVVVGGGLQLGGESKYPGRQEHTATLL